MVTRVPPRRKPAPPQGPSTTDRQGRTPLFSMPGLRGPTAGVLLLALAAAQWVLADDTRPLRSQLQELAGDSGFTITGLEKLAPADAPAHAGTPVVERIKALLRGYDHVIVHGDGTGVERLIILGPKRAAPPPALATDENILKTRRQGSQHLVSLKLQGPAGAPRQIEFMIDTGASLMVLPESIGQELGFDTGALERRSLQTAKGQVAARIGRLGWVEVGPDRLPDVEVALVDDEHLGGNALLGMNVLGRYLFILDDEHDELTLIPDTQRTPQPP